MSDRKRLVSTLWLASSLALLASVSVVPAWTSGGVSVSSWPDCPRRDFALSTTLLSAATATDADPQANALISDDDDEERDRAVALDVPQVSFLIPCSFHKAPDRLLIAPPSIPSFYPLRC